MHDGDSSFKFFKSFTLGQEKGLLKIPHCNCIDV